MATSGHYTETQGKRGHLLAKRTGFNDGAHWGLDLDLYSYIAGTNFGHFCDGKPFLQQKAIFSTENGVIKLLPNQKRERQKEKLDGQGPRKQVRQTMHLVTSIISMCMCALIHCSVEHFEPKGR